MRVNRFLIVTAAVTCALGGQPSISQAQANCSLTCELLANPSLELKSGAQSADREKTIIAIGKIYEQAEKQKNFDNSMYELLMSPFLKGTVGLATQPFPAAGPYIQAYADVGIDKTFEYLKDQNSQALTTLLRSRLPEVERLIATRSDGTSLSDALKPLTGELLSKITDPQARAYALSIISNLQTADIDRMRVEGRASRSDADRANRLLNGKLARILQETRTTQATVEQLSQEIAAQSEIVLKLVQAMGPEAASHLAVLGTKMDEVGRTFTAFSQTLGLLGASEDAQKAAAIGGTVLSIAGRTFTGTLTPDVALQGLNTLIGLFQKPRPDPTIAALNRALARILEAMAEYDRRNHERFLATLAAIEQVESRVLDVQLGMSSLLLAGISQCIMLLPSDALTADAWMTDQSAVMFPTYGKFVSQYSTSRFALPACRAAIQNSFLIAPRVNEGISDRFLANEIKFRLQNSRTGTSVEKADITTKQLFGLFRESISLATDLLMPEFLSLLSTQPPTTRSLDRLVSVVAPQASCIRADAKPTPRGCLGPVDWELFWRNFGVLVDPEAVAAAVRLGGGLLPYYELLDDKDEPFSLEIVDRRYSELRRPIVKALLRGMHLASSVGSAQQSVLGGHFLIPIAHDVILGRWDNLSVSCTSAQAQTAPPPSCNSPTKYGYLVNQGLNLTSEPARNALRQRIVDHLDGTSRRSSNVLFKRNLALYAIRRLMSEPAGDAPSKFNFGAYQLARSYEGSPYPLQLALNLAGTPWTIAASTDAERPESGPWVLASGNMRFVLPPVEDVISDRFAYSSFALTAARTLSSVETWRTDYLYFPANLQDRSVLPRVAYPSGGQPGFK